MIVFLTVVVSVLVGLFWMFTIIVGLNGVTGPKGGYLVWSHVGLLVAMLLASGMASARLEQLLVGTYGWSAWLAGPAIVLAVPLLMYAALFVCSVVLILMIGVK